MLIIYRKKKETDWTLSLTRLPEWYDNDDDDHSPTFTSCFCVKNRSKRALSKQKV